MLLFVWQFDPRGGKVGGVGRYVLSFIKSLPVGFDVGVVGVTTDLQEVGSWKVIDLNGRSVKFFPVVYVSDENKKNIIPLSLRFCIGLYRLRRCIPSDATLFYQRIEYVISSIGMTNKRFSIFHFDISRYLDKASGESYWSKFPMVFRRLITWFVGLLDGVFSVNMNSIDYLKNDLEVSNVRLLFAPTWADSDIFCYMDNLSKVGEKNVISDYDYPVNTKFVVLVGRLNKQKNIGLALQVVSNVSNAVLIVIGDGPSRLKSEKRAAELGLSDRVIFLGMQSQSKIRDVYCFADAYISTSKTEGMSVALLEAMSMGVPVVTTPTGEAARIISNGENGFVSTSWESEELSRLLGQVLGSKLCYSQAEIFQSISNWTAETIVPKMLAEMDHS